MTDKNTQIEVHTYNWGPCLIKVNILDEFRQILLEEAKQTEIDYKDKLAGQIAKERGYTDKQREKIIPYLSPYLGVYDEAFQRFQNKRYEKKPEYTLTALWCNFQRQYEFNPPHDHDGKLSFVIYLSIPEPLKEENKKYSGRSCGPGGIQFMYGEGPRDAVTYMSYFPKEGDMFIFPAWLKHWVSPFNSDCVRVSVSGNVHDSAPLSQVRKGMLKGEKDKLIEQTDEEYLKELKEKL